jgi:hypothetical protein
MVSLLKKYVLTRIAYIIAIAGLYIGFYASKMTTTKEDDIVIKEAIDLIQGSLLKSFS